MGHKKVKVKQPVPPVSEWGIAKYGLQLFLNPEPRVEGSIWSLDVEDDEKGNFIGIGICNGNSCFYWSEWSLAKQLNLTPFIAHNGRTDISKLQKWGFDIDDSWLTWDTQIMAHILDSSRKMYGLKALSKADLAIEYPSYEDLTGKKGSSEHVTLDKLPLELVAEYNAMDCYSTYKLYEKQKALCA